MKLRNAPPLCGKCGKVHPRKRLSGNALTVLAACDALRWAERPATTVKWSVKNGARNKRIKTVPLRGLAPDPGDRVEDGDRCLDCGRIIMPANDKTRGARQVLCGVESDPYVVFAVHACLKREAEVSRARNWERTLLDMTEQEDDLPATRPPTEDERRRGLTARSPVVQKPDVRDRHEDGRSVGAWKSPSFEERKLTEKGEAMFVSPGNMHGARRVIRMMAAPDVVVRRRGDAPAQPATTEPGGSKRARVGWPTK